jgi:HK97 family phage major capsid protein
MRTMHDRYVAAKQAATDIHDAAKAANRPLTEDERTRFDALVVEANELRAQHERALADSQALSTLTDLDDLAVAPTATATARPRRNASWGEQFAASDAYKAMLSSFNGNVPAGTRVQMGAVTVPDLRAALITDPGFYSPAIEVVRTPQYTDNLFDAISVVDDAPQVIKTFVATFTSAATTVAEGVAKPEASLSWTPTTITLGTEAHWVPVTNQALSHNSLVRDEIDTNLVSGVRARLAALVATKVAAGAGMQTQAFDWSIVKTLRKAITKAQTAAATLGTGAISILISALDAEALDLEQIANLVLAPGQTPQQATGIWRSPLVVSPTLPSGYAYVGDLKQIKLYTSGGVNVTTGWQNTQFIENELTILAETEAAAAVRLAAALVKADVVA